MTSEGLQRGADFWVGGFGVAPADPPQPSGRATADVLLSAYLAHADLIIEAIDRAPLLVRYHQARQAPVISASDWVLGLAAWSLALYGVVIDAEARRLEAGELLSADGRQSAAALIGVARRRLAVGIDFDELALLLEEDRRWAARAPVAWEHGQVSGRRARKLGEPCLGPGAAAIEVGRTEVGRLVLGQSAMLAESADPSIAGVYAALRRLAVSLSRGASSLPAFGGQVVPALRQVLARQAEHAARSPFREVSVNGP